MSESACMCVCATACMCTTVYMSLDGSVHVHVKVHVSTVLQPNINSLIWNPVHTCDCLYIYIFIYFATHL